MRLSINTFKVKLRRWTLNKGYRDKILFLQMLLNEHYNIKKNLEILAGLFLKK